MAHRLSLLALLAACALPLMARAQPAFPGAIGFGAVATGGRGGRVIHVTTLAGSGPGSLAEAARASGPRYVVFDVSGVIEGDVEITSGDLTIAGQTAPGAGITIHGHLTTSYGDAISNIVIRHIRVRPPGPGGEWEPAGHDAIQMSDGRRLYFDHVDVSHGVDELVDHWLGGTEITWSASIFSFPDPMGGHPDGSHPYCLIAHDGDEGTAGGRVSIVGNLFAHCRVRTPALSIGPAEAVNNVIYDAREGFVHHNQARGDFVIAGNTYLDGPSLDLSPFWLDAENDPAPTDYYFGDNRVDHPGTFTGIVDDPWATPGFADEYTFAPDHIGRDQFHPLSEAPTWSGGYAPYERLSPTDAEARVLDCAGAWPRDHVSSTAVAETRSRTGMIRRLALGDLLMGLSPGTRPADGDEDGMPDAWESAHGLDPRVDDHGTSLEGWPAIEVYLDELADSLAPCGGVIPPADAGVPMGTDGGTVLPGEDAGPLSMSDAAVSPGMDAGARADAGRGAAVSADCGCRVGRAAEGTWPLAALTLLTLVLASRRRRRP